MQKTTIFAPGYERVTDAGGTTRHYYYIYGSDGLAAVYVKESGQTDKICYAMTDHLGSIVKLTDKNGTEVFAAKYDAWGKQTITTNTIGFHRGYTGHEHLAEFGLINMNGRMYDPILGRMLSPDNYVANPLFSQDFNRYAYARNNPLKYTDPTGEFIFSALLPGIGIFIDAACWGAVIGGAGYTASVAFSDGGFNNWNWGDFGKSVGFGAISGVATAGIGQIFGPVGSFGNELARAYTHGFANGMISQFSGGDFLTGFATGGLGSLGGSAFTAFGGKFAQTALGQVSFSALSGGIGAELTGGDFWRGAATGATVGLLNHAKHIQQSNQQTKLQVKAVRAFLEDLGYSADQVAQDVVMQRDGFFSKYYAQLDNFDRYAGSFTGGQYDSYSGTNDAYLSVTRTVTIAKFLGISFTEDYAAKYYPSRAHSIGLVRPGAYHYVEAGLEYMDGKARGWTGRDNLIYDMHGRNAFRYLKYR